MVDYVKTALFEYRYILIDAWKLDCERFLAQDNPDALIFAILCDFKDRDARDVVAYIVERLQALTKDQERRYRDYIVMLDVLASNRDLQPILEEVEPMLNLNVENLGFYQAVMKKGIAQGIEKGMERGVEKGRKEGWEQGQEATRADLVQKLLTRMDADQVAEWTGLDCETVLRLGRDRRH